ncbi:MAG: high-potential iron-sulfur protein [Myxococcales bacterium]|jgi:hypothetical protein
MNAQTKVTRRELIRGTVSLGVAVAGVAVLSSACKETPKGLSCSDTAGLVPADIKTRTDNVYVEKSTDAAKNCTNCSMFKAGAAGACGACVLVKGPINPGGNCKAWAAKPT